MRRLNYRDYSWAGTDWMSTFFTRQELGKQANFAGVCDITAAAIHKGPVGSPTPLGLVLGWNVVPWDIAVAFWQSPWELHSSLKSAALHSPWGWEEKGDGGKVYLFIFLIFVSWFLHVVLSIWYPSRAPAQNSEPYGDCWLRFMQWHALLAHMPLLWASKGSSWQWIVSPSYHGK